MKRREFVALLGALVGGAVAWPLAARAEAVGEAGATGFDPRITPARPDLAAKHLAGKVEAKRFAEGKVYEVGAPLAPLRGKPAHEAELSTEALKGERITVYEISENGWAWGQLAGDGYVGYLPASALREPGPAATHKVSALRTFVFPGTSIRLPPAETLSFGSRLAIARTERLFAITADGGHVPVSHLAPVESRRLISSRSPSVSSVRLICGAARPASASTVRGWCSLRSTPAASPVRATPTCRSGRWGRRWRIRASSTACAAATWCSGRAMSRSCATTRRSCTPTPRATWVWHSSRSPKRSRASAASPARS
jgi:hypothetical protein